MRFAFGAALAAALVLSAAACDVVGLGDGDLEAPRPGDVTVLFIGSSYLAYHDVPTRFEGLARRAGVDVWAQSRLLPGHYLEWFAADASTLLLLQQRKWDFVVLQDAGPAIAYPARLGPVAQAVGFHPVLPALRELKRNATALSPATTVVWMLPWAFEDGITWIPGQTDDYAAMQGRIRANAVPWADSLGLALAPVGMAFHRVMTTWNPPTHFLFESDWNHANATGAYLTAATLFTTLFPRDVTDVPYDWTLDRDLARRLRAVASATVLDSLDLWNVRR